jgi:hypothetical protein
MVCKRGSSRAGEGIPGLQTIIPLANGRDLVVCVAERVDAMCFFGAVAMSGAQVNKLPTGMCRDRYEGVAAAPPQRRSSALKIN